MKLKKGTLVGVACTLISVAICVAAFQAAQALVIPKFKTDGTAITTAYRYLDENSVDALFIGSSQMFCTIDAQRLTEEHGISFFDYGASGQEFAATKYYFDTALQRQRPRLVMLETCSALVEGKYVGSDALAWNYTAMPASAEKFWSLYEILNGDIPRSLEYTFTPIIEYHDRWKSLNHNDFSYLLDPRGFSADTLRRRGFLPREHVESGLSIALASDSPGKATQAPARNVETIRYIMKRCEAIGAKLVLFKSPDCDWTRSSSDSVKALAKELSLTYLDLNEHAEEIGLDVSKDFYNARHLNTYGAEKTTKWIVPFLKDNLS